LLLARQLPTTEIFLENYIEAVRIETAEIAAFPKCRNGCLGCFVVIAKGTVLRCSYDSHGIQYLFIIRNVGRMARGINSALGVDRIAELREVFQLLPHEALVHAISPANYVFDSGETFPAIELLT
jgi:hypothetical protein